MCLNWDRKKTPTRTDRAAHVSLLVLKRNIFETHITKINAIYLLPTICTNFDNKYNITNLKILFMVYLSNTIKMRKYNAINYNIVHYAYK